jgi:GrpB-like predicted nucleotidyltransferase (UPF0157 family)
MELGIMNNGVRPIGPYFEKKAELLPYDPASILVADEIIGLILDHLPFVIVDHIGSTAVPGLAGKGIIDLLIAYPDDHLQTVKDVLADLGFEPQPHFDPFPENRPMRVGSYEYMGAVYLIHVHVIKEDSPEVYEMRAFRDRLRYDRTLQTEYVVYKNRIIQSGFTSSTEYARAKGKFIQEILLSK